MVRALQQNVVVKSVALINQPSLVNAAGRGALCEGACMRIHGLHSYQEFNGKVGTVCNHNVASSRRKLGMVYVCLDSGLWVERKHSLLDDKHEMVCDKPSMENGREKRFGYQAASLSGPSVSKNNLRGFSL